MMPLMDEDAPTADESQQAADLFRRMGRASCKIADSSLEKKLRQKLGPNGLAGAHILRSYELMLEQGKNLDDTIRQHQQMVDMLRRILNDNVRQHGLDTDTPFSMAADAQKH
jgi:hypothetical protein